MPTSIPDHVYDFFKQHSNIWRTRFEDIRTFEDARCNLVTLGAEEAQDILGTAISYLAQAQNEINIYQAGLDRLKASESEGEVDLWLDSVGFHIKHNQLGQALVNRIASLFQNIIQVIRNFIQSIIGVLNMRLLEVSFTFSASPSVQLKFT
jgi:hypothetical protein